MKHLLYICKGLFALTIFMLVLVTSPIWMIIFHSHNIGAKEEDKWDSPFNW